MQHQLINYMITYLFLVKRGGGVRAGEGEREYFLLLRCLSLECDLDLLLDLLLDRECDLEDRESLRCFLRDRRWDEREWLRLRLLDLLALLPLLCLPFLPPEFLQNKMPHQYMQVQHTEVHFFMISIIHRFAQVVLCCYDILITFFVPPYQKCCGWHGVSLSHAVCWKTSTKAVKD